MSKRARKPKAKRPRKAPEPQNLKHWRGLFYTVGPDMTTAYIRICFEETVCPLMWAHHMGALNPGAGPTHCHQCVDFIEMGCSRAEPPVECFARGDDRHYCDANDCTLCFTEPDEWFPDGEPPTTRFVL